MDPGQIDAAGIAARQAAVVSHVEPVRQKLPGTGENELGEHDSSVTERQRRHRELHRDGDDPEDRSDEGAEDEEPSSTDDDGPRLLDVRV